MVKEAITNSTNLKNFFDFRAPQYDAPKDNGPNSNY